MKVTPETHVTYSLQVQESGAKVLREITKFSKTIGQTVAAKEGLLGEDAEARAAEIKRCLRRVRLAFEDVGV